MAIVIQYLKGMATLVLCACSLLVCPRPLAAQVVQLPTVEVFAVGTTVVIPDGGAAYLGGVGRAAYGSHSSGVPMLGKLPYVGRLFGNRGFGSEVNQTSAWATATIIDLGEMDRRLLEEARTARQAPSTSSAEVQRSHAIARKAAFLSRHVGQRPRDLP